MRRIVLAFAFAFTFGSFGSVATVSAAKKKPKTSGTAKKEREKLPAPDDKGTNEGGAGRRNATEDAARAAESPTNDRRP